jgi:hypothetical protein
VLRSSTNKYPFPKTLLLRWLPYEKGSKIERRKGLSSGL